MAFSPFLWFTLSLGLLATLSAAAPPATERPLWQVYTQTLKKAKYVDLTHAISPTIPVWAICPPDWKYGVAVSQVPDSPLAKMAKPLHWDEKLGARVR